MPAIVAAANPAYADAAGPATILIAACVVVTAILTPILTSWVASKVGRDVEPDAEEIASTDPVIVSPAPAVGR